MFLGIHVLLPQPFSNCPRFMHCIYRYSHASKLFVEVLTILQTIWTQIRLLFLGAVSSRFIFFILFTFMKKLCSCRHEKQTTFSGPKKIVVDKG